MTQAQLVRPGPTTGQTGPLRIGHQSRPVRPVDQTGQTGSTQIGCSKGLITIGRIRTICVKLLKILEIWTSWAKVSRRLIL